MTVKAMRKARLFVERLEDRVALSSVPNPAGPAEHAVFNAATSTNWSGYAAETNISRPASNVVTFVSGQWVVPTVTGSSSQTTYSSMWVGIDGFSDSTVEQTGTEQDVINGVATYDAWYETVPNEAEIVITSMTVKPGDTMSASVTSVGNSKFTMSITNVTENESFSITQTQLGAKRSSAEWIVEAPTVNGSIASLANFGTATFTNAQATINKKTGPIDSSSWQNTSINMVNSSGATKASTGSLTDSTSGGVTTSKFSVTFVSSNSVLAAANLPGNGKSHAKNMPMDNSSGNPGTSTALTSLTQQQLALSLVGPSVNLPSVTGVLTPLASASVSAPLAVVQLAGSAGSTGLFSRTIGVTGGGDRLDAGLTVPEDPSLLPAPTDDWSAPAAPAGPTAPTDNSTNYQSMSRARLDAYFIAASGAEASSASAPDMIPPTEERTTVRVEVEASMTGLIVLLGGCWTVQRPREEEKKQAGMRDWTSGG
jgi:hypothetical protein